MPNDEDIQKQIEHDNIVKALSCFNYEGVVSDLLNKGVFKPGDHYIEIDKTDEYPVFILLQDSDENTTSYFYTVDEFEKILTKLRDAKIELYPEEQENYTELTNKLIAKLRQ